MEQASIYTKINNLKKSQFKELDVFLNKLIAKKKIKIKKKEPTFGFYDGQIVMSDDFDEPLEDFEEYMA